MSAVIKTLTFSDEEELRDTIKALLIMLANQEQNSVISPYHLGRVSMMIMDMIPEQADFMIKQRA